MTDKQITRQEAEELFRVAEEELVFESWRKASEALGGKRNFKTLKRDYGLAVVLAERFKDAGMRGLREISESDMTEIERRVGYGISKKRIKQFALWYLDRKRTKEEETKRLDETKERIAQELIWPDWKEIPVDLFHRTGPVRLLAGSREIRFDIVTDGAVKTARGPVPGSDVEESQLAEAVGIEGTRAFRELAELWATRISEYMNFARALNQQVSENGGAFDSLDHLAREVREMEMELEVLRAGIFDILKA